MNTRIIGCHLSVAKVFAALGKDARQIGANTFQFHSRNPRGGAVKKRTDADIAAYVELIEQDGCVSPGCSRAVYAQSGGC